MKKVLNKTNEVFYEIIRGNDRVVISTHIERMGLVYYFKTDSMFNSEFIISDSQLMFIEKELLARYERGDKYNKAIVRKTLLNLNLIIDRLSKIPNIEVYYVSDKVIKFKPDKYLNQTVGKMSNTGYENITIIRKYITLVIRKNGVIYSKRLAYGKKHTYGFLLLKLIHHRCDILGIKYPEVIDTATGLNYLIDKFNYAEPYEFDINKDFTLDLPVKFIDTLKLMSDNMLYSDRSNTGYKNINIRIVENRFIEVVYSNRLNKVCEYKRINATTTYYKLLGDFIAMHCEYLGITPPSNIDYNIGIDYVIANGLKDKLNINYDLLLKSDITTTGYKNIMLSETRGIVSLVCDITIDNKNYVSTKRLTKHNYRKALYDLLKFKCGVLGYEMPKNIDYIKGMDAYLSLLNPRK